MSGYVGGSNVSDVARLRRMIAEPTTGSPPGPYTDADLVAAIERYPVPDPEDVYPDEDGWIPSYDLAMAASEIWSEKAANVAANYDFSAGDESFSKSQQYTHALQQARYWQAKRIAGTWTVTTRACRRRIHRWQLE